MPQIPRPRNLLVDFLSILFGISSWIGVTSVYLQLPLLVDSAPEGWKLPSYIAILVQGGNIASLVYVIYEKYSRWKISDGKLITIILFVGCAAAIALAFLYNVTTEIAGQRHSVALLVFSSIFAIIGCISAVLFMPYMGRFREIYLISFMLGQGLNAFISSIVSLIQGVGSSTGCPTNLTDAITMSTESVTMTTAATAATVQTNQSKPLFSPKVYFLFLFCSMLCSTVAFILLHNLKQCRRELVVKTNSGSYERETLEKEKNEYEIIPEQVQRMTRFNYGVLMFWLAAISFFGYGVFPGLQPYSSRPYGSIAYHLSTSLAAFANPLACFLAMFLSHVSIRNLTIQSVFVLAVTIFLFCTAVDSPRPPFVGTTFGTILIVREFQHFVFVLFL